jgi:hypothetical protein
MNTRRMKRRIHARTALQIAARRTIVQAFARMQAASIAAAGAMQVAAIAATQAADSFGRLGKGMAIAETVLRTHRAISQVMNGAR